MVFKRGKNPKSHVMNLDIKRKISKKLKGRVPWNKGLTGETNKIIRKSNEKNSESHKRSFKEGKVQWNYVDGRSKGKGREKYGCDWEKIRQLILRRDNFICQKCGIKKKKLDIHHKIPFLISLDNSINNLITLCRSCHVKEEARMIDKLKNKREQNVLYNY